MSPGSIRRERTTRIRRGNEVRVRQLLTDERELRLVRSQLRLALGDVLYARPGDREIESLPINFDLGVGDIQCGFGVVDILLRGGGLLDKKLLALVESTGVGRIRHRGCEVRPRLCDLFGTTAVVQPLYRSTLRGYLRPGLSNLRLQTTGVHFCQELAFVNDVAFLDEHDCDSLVTVERQIDLS